jgi:ABC-type uncharacterized transport system fused permease/ATPase subunit
LLHRPRWVFRDEATFALDDVNEASMLDRFYNGLAADLVVLSFGYRSGLEEFHSRTLHISDGIVHSFVHPGSRWSHSGLAVCSTTGTLGPL